MDMTEEHLHELTESIALILANVEDPTSPEWAVLPAAEAVAGAIAGGALDHIVTVRSPGCTAVWAPRPDFGPCVRPAGHEGDHIVHADVIEFE